MTGPGGSGQHRLVRAIKVGVAAATLGLLAGCGGSGGAQVSRNAVRQLGLAVDNTAITSVEIGGDEIGRLAVQAKVGDDAIRQTATNLDDQSRWQRWLSGTRTVYQGTPSDVRSSLLDLACDGVSGGITSAEELAAAIGTEFIGYSLEEQMELYYTVWTLWADLYEAHNSADPGERSAAVVTCFTVAQVAGLG
jgi:hypothetical protein